MKLVLKTLQEFAKTSTMGKDQPRIGPIWAHMFQKSSVRVQSENQGIQLSTFALAVFEGLTKARKSQLQRDFIYFLHAAETPKWAVGGM